MATTEIVPISSGQVKKRGGPEFRSLPICNIAQDGSAVKRGGVPVVTTVASGSTADAI